MRGTHERRPSPPWPTIGAPACIVTKLAEISAYLGEFAAVPMMQEQSLSSRRNPVRISAIHPSEPFAFNSEIDRSRPKAAIRLSYSITSSARERIDGGMVKPSALAVLRLTTSSNVVGCCTGRSAGLAPLAIRST